MEITARPRRRSRRVGARLLLAAAVVLALAVLTPAALGLQQHAVTDDAMSGSYPRGALVLGELVPVEELGVGDVITFRAPVDGAEGGRVTRRIVDIQRDRVVTQGDASEEVDPWLLRLDATEMRLVTYTVPWLGYPWIVVGAAAPLLGGLLVAALLLLVVRMRHRARTAAAARVGRRPGATSGARVSPV